MKKMPRWFVLVLLCLGLIALILLLLHFLRPGNVSAPSVTKNTTTTKKTTPTPTLVFAAMGDMLAHDSINRQARAGDKYDYKPYFSHIRPLYKNADVVFCNPETLATGQKFGVSGYPTFNAPTEFARDLVDRNGAACDIINLATNHMNDKRQAGIDTTLDEWDSLKPLAHTGANRNAQEQNAVSYFEKNGIKVAFLAFADYSNDPNLIEYGVNIYHNDALVSRLVTEAKAHADAVIVSMHWGTENMNTANDDQRQAAQRLADLGVTVVIGTGPHVIQEAAYITGSGGQKTLVWYSIGNMLSSQLKINELTGGVAGFTLKKASGTMVAESPTFKPTFMSYVWPAADRAADNLAARSDFQLLPLSASGSRIEAMFGSNYSSFERLNYVKTTLTDAANITVGD